MIISDLSHLKVLSTSDSILGGSPFWSDSLASLQDRIPFNFQDFHQKVLALINSIPEDAVGVFTCAKSETSAQTGVSQSWSAVSVIKDQEIVYSSVKSSPVNLVISF